ncbi:MAG: hypothetical protein KDF64_07325, partial [Geminicoccaceae bacterium]|nr:hypothetical protein [Geminicoccaceae bacterium]
TGDARSGKKRAASMRCGEKDCELRRRSGAQRYCAGPLASSFPVLFVPHRGYRHFFNTLLISRHRKGWTFHRLVLAEHAHAAP